MRERFNTALAASVMALCTVWATDARAACFDMPLKHPVAVPKLQFGGHNGGASFGNKEPFGSHESIAGLWAVNFYFGEGPDLYDQGFEQFHTDGTELMVDNGVPPVLGNVCVGVWKQVGPRTIKLRHVTWNWDGNNKVAGTFLLLMTVKLDRRGNTFEGKYQADSFDLTGAIIPEAHVEGVVRATRITVD